MDVQGVSWAFLGVQKVSQTAWRYDMMLDYDSTAYAWVDCLDMGLRHQVLATLPAS